MTAGRSAVLLPIVAILLPALALVAALPSRPLILAVLNDAAHVPVFGALALILLHLLGRWSRWSSARREIVAFVLTVATGGVVEWMQRLISRDAEWSDLGLDALGAIAALGLARFIRDRRWPGALVLTVAATIAFWPLGEAGFAYLERVRQFPTLLDFDSKFDQYFVQSQGVEMASAELPERYARSGDSRSLRIRITGGRWPGVSHVEPQPDWRRFSRLTLDLTNPGTRALTLTLRVHDRVHDNRGDDRFNRTFALPAGERTLLSFPLSEIAEAPRLRAMDMSCIAGIVVFANDDSEQVGREFYLTRVRVE